MDMISRTSYLNLPLSPPRDGRSRSTWEWEKQISNPKWDHERGPAESLEVMPEYLVIITSNLKYNDFCHPLVPHFGKW